MHKKLFTALLLLFLFLTPAAIACEEGKNPIDKAFSADLNREDLPTPLLRQVYGAYLAAWKEELENAVSWRKQGLKFEEDRKRLDDYLVRAGELAETAGDIEIQYWSDTDTPPDRRSGTMGTGGPGAMVFARALIYRDLTLRLVASLGGAGDDRPYVYKYSGNGAGIDEPE